MLRVYLTKLLNLKRRCNLMIDLVSRNKIRILTQIQFKKLPTSSRLLVQTQVYLLTQKIFSCVKIQDLTVTMMAMMITATSKKMRMMSYKLALSRWRQQARRLILISSKKMMAISHNLIKLLGEERKKLPRERQLLILSRTLDNKQQLMKNQQPIRKITKDRVSLIHR